MLWKSLVTKRCTGFLCFVETKRRTLRYGPPFYFEAINNISSDAESREEQNGASRFVIQGGVTYILTVERSATGVKLKINGQGLQKLSSHRSNKKLHGQETK